MTMLYKNIETLKDYKTVESIARRVEKQFKGIPEAYGEAITICWELLEKQKRPTYPAVKKKVLNYINRCLFREKEIGIDNQNIEELYDAKRLMNQLKKDFHEYLNFDISQTNKRYIIQEIENKPIKHYSTTTLAILLEFRKCYYNNLSDCPCSKVKKPHTHKELKNLIKIK